MSDEKPFDVQAWLEELYAQSSVSAAVHMVYEQIDELMTTGRVDLVDEVFEKIDVNRVEVSPLASLLVITGPQGRALLAMLGMPDERADAPKGREAFGRRAKARAVELRPGNEEIASWFDNLIGAADPASGDEGPQEKRVRA